MLDTAELFVEVNQRTIKKVPALKGRVVASLFFEESTRTRLSFETAAKRLSADVLSLAVASSSVKKGESLRDTIATIDALGIDAVVMRHQSSGAAHQVGGYVPHVRVINAGDGLHQHPTQGLLDAFTVRQVLAERVHAKGSETGRELFAGLHVLIVGDVRHSRVARSDIAAYSALGRRGARRRARARCCPRRSRTGPSSVVDDFDEALEWADVVVCLRLQRERGTGSFVPSLGEFTQTYGLTAERARRLRPATIIMHPGPMNRGVEIDSRVADLPERGHRTTGQQRRAHSHGGAVSECRRFTRGVEIDDIPASPRPPRRTATRRAWPTCWCVTDASSRSASHVDAPAGATVHRRRGLLGGSGIRRPAHPPARARSRGGRDDRIGCARRRRRRVLRTRGDAQHRARPRQRRAGVLRARQGCAHRPWTSRSPGRSPRAARVATSRQWPKWRRLGVRLFTDDGTGVQDPSMMRRALDYARPLGVRLAQHCEDEALAARWLDERRRAQQSTRTRRPAGARRGTDGDARHRARATHGGSACTSCTSRRLVQSLW